MPRSTGAPGLNARTMSAFIVLLRVFVGVKFLLAGVEKWDWIGIGTLAGTVRQWAASDAAAGLGRYAQFLTETILPHASLATYLIVFGEVGVGLLLILGLCTRFAALLAMVITANYLLATWPLGSAARGIHETFLLLEIAFLWLGAGRVIGLDMLISRGRPGWILW